MRFLAPVRQGLAAVLGIALSIAAALPLTATADPIDQAKRIHDRLVGIPPSPQTLQTMETMITTPGQGPVAAAFEARWLERRGSTE